MNAQVQAVLMLHPFPCSVCGGVFPLDDMNVDTDSGEKTCDACLSAIDSCLVAICSSCLTDPRQ